MLGDTDNTITAIRIIVLSQSQTEIKGEGDAAFPANLKLHEAQRHNYLVSMLSNIGES